MVSAEAWLQLLVLVTTTTVMPAPFSGDGEFIFGVLHEDNERPAVTVYTVTKSPTTYHFPEHTRLVQTCTSPTRVCPDIHLDVIFTGHSQQNVVIMAKLEDAIGFMELQNYSSTAKETKPIIEVLSISQSGSTDPCDPLDIVQIGGVWTVYCIQSSYLFYCELVINFTSYSSSSLECRYLSDTMIRQPSDFLLTPDSDTVYFVDGNTLYRIIPANDDLRPFSHIPLRSCRHLDYVQDELLLYCSASVSLKIDSNRLARTQLINETAGITFACHRSDIYYTVKQNPVNTEVRISNFSVSLNQSSFADTKCIHFKNMSFIIVADAHAEITIIDENLISIARVPAGCSISNPCRRLLAFADPVGVAMVVFKEGGQVEVLVLDSMFRLYDTLQITGTFAGLVPLFPPEILDVAAENSTEGRNDKAVSFGRTEVITTITAAVVAMVIAILVCITIILSVVIKRKRKNRTGSNSSSTIGDNNQQRMHDLALVSFNTNDRVMPLPVDTADTAIDDQLASTERKPTAAPDLDSDHGDQPRDILHCNTDSETTTVPIDAGATPVQSPSINGAYDLSPNTVATEVVNGGAIRDHSQHQMKIL